MSKYKIAIIGAGPGGMSAAAHAAELDISHILLESTAHHANTIQRFQKGKHVMAEPGTLPLRSDLQFDAGTRESVLQNWSNNLEHKGINIQYDSAVCAVDGVQGDFKITLNSGETVGAENIILGIGVQGNPRKIDVPGEDLPVTQYTLDDPDEYANEIIVVVGAGDAAIENAVALAKQNIVYIINRGSEFVRTKDANNALILRHIADRTVECFYMSNPASIEQRDIKQKDRGEKPYTLWVQTETGKSEVPCDRIIVRIGAIPQRALIESFGVQFANADPTSQPELNEKLESSVPGMYILGALAGNPLIKHAINQGYEVVEHILGNPIDPVEYEILGQNFSSLPFGMKVSETLQLLQERVPMFAEINPLLFREFMFDSNILARKASETIFKQNDHTDTLFTLLIGQVQATGDDNFSRTIESGQIFGEHSLISGLKRNVTVVCEEESYLIETPRRTMIKLINSNETIARGIDEIFAINTIQKVFAPTAPMEVLRKVAKASEIRTFKRGETIYDEGEQGNSLHLIRVGSVTLSRNIGGKDVVISYIPAEHYIGEMGLMGQGTRAEKARASVRTETISINKDSFLDLLESEPELKEKFQSQVKIQLRSQAELAARPKSGDVISFFMEQGLGESNDVLIIDESLCVGCNNCEKACAETHDGVSRLQREAGATYESFHIPISCRHCEHPHCMKDCPPDAIHRGPDGEVFIDDTCIGCGNCANNCPYDAIHLTVTPPKKPGLLTWLLTGAGPGPGEDKNFVANKDMRTKAVKCDQCRELGSGPACVRACPTGAALRISQDKFVDLVSH